MTLRRIGVWSAARISLVLGAVVGLLVGATMSAVILLSMLTTWTPSSGPLLSFGNAWFGVSAVVLVPILYGATGLVGGAVAALLYNLSARLVGGLALEFEGRA
jgi:hypothetical protein